MTKTNTITHTTHTSQPAVDFVAIAQLALKDDANESMNKGRGRVRTLSAILAAQRNECMGNHKLEDVALLESKTEKGDAYKRVYSAVFDNSETAKMSNTFKNKLKIACDVLAYVARMEAKHQRELARINETGDVIHVCETLLDPAVSVKGANWYSTDSKAKTKAKTSIDELARAARKFMLDETGESLPQVGSGDGEGSRAGRKGKNEGDKSATTLHGVSLIEALDLVSGQIQTAQAKADNKLASELKDAMVTLRAVITDALVNDETARKPVKASKKEAA